MLTDNLAAYVHRADREGPKKEQQPNAINAWLKAKGLEIPKENWYVDVGGIDQNHPPFQRWLEINAMLTENLAAYVRVSSTKGQKIDSQVNAINNHLRAKDAEIAKDHWYVDKGKTGTNQERPQFQRLLKDIEVGKINQVVIFKLDRLGRSCRELLNTLHDWQGRNVNLVSINESIDLQTPLGRCVVAILAAIAELETEFRRERAMAGIEAYLETHDKLPGGRKKGSRHKVTPERIEEIVKAKKEGKTISKIARLFDLSRPTIYSVLAEVKPSVING